MLKLVLTAATVLLVLAQLRWRRTKTSTTSRTAESDSRSLFADWSAHGIWWISTRAQEKVPGTLFYHGTGTQRGMELRLNQSLDFRGALDDDLFERDGAFEDQPTVWVHGLAASEYLSLGDAMIGHANLSARCFPKYAITGPKTIDRLSTFSSATAVLPGLKEFFTPVPKTSLIKFPLSLTLQKEGVEFELDFISEAVTESIALRLRPRLNQSMQWFEGTMFSLQYFFSILYGAPTCPLSIVLAADGGSFQLWYSFDRDRVNSALTWDCMSVLGNELGSDGLLNALRAWFELDKPFMDYVYNFLGNVFHPHPKGRVNFVFYSQSLERFHALENRKFRISKAQRNAVKQVSKFIDDNIDESFRKDFKEVLQYVSKPNQATRFNHLFLRVQRYIPIFNSDVGESNEVPSEIADFARCVVKTRNYHIHGGKKPKAFLDHEAETIASEGLKLMNFLLMLQKLGVPSQVTRVENSEPYRNWAQFKGTFLNPSVLAAKVEPEGIVPSRFEVTTDPAGTCFRCGGAVFRHAFKRYGEVLRTTHRCQKQRCNQESEGKCLFCGQPLSGGGSSGWSGTQMWRECTNSECPRRT